MTLLLIVLILFLVFGWHFFFALLGGVLVISAAGIFIAIASIVMFSIAVLVGLTLPGAIGLAFGVIFAIWTIVAIVLAPILFPIVLPLLIIYAALAMRQKKVKRRPIKIINEE